MPRPRRTEHCWPVAHSLDDLLDVIPDPATYNPEEGVFIQRFMLEPVRNQFIRAIADRFEAAGWGVIYLVNNNWRGQEILEVIPNAEIMCVRPGWQKRLEIAKECNQEIGLRSVTINEVLNCHHEAILSSIRVPLAVQTIHPVACLHCCKDTYMHWDRQRMKPVWRCYVGHEQWREDACLPVRPGKGRSDRLGLRTRRPWTEAEDRLAIALRAEGLTCSQIGERLDRSAACIHDHLRNGGMAGTAARRKARALLKDDF